MARLIFSKLLLNSPDHRPTADFSNEKETTKRHSCGNINRKESKRPLRDGDCFVDLKMRRKLALILYHASTSHLPENNQFGPQSLGASVEVAFGVGLFGSSVETNQDRLLELATDSSYQKFYIWVWRILFALRLHILDQVETDWNDVQMQSGTSRSTKNTVLADDPFYPVPSIEDPECMLLSDGIASQNPVASFIYLFLTDVTWHHDTWSTCLMQLNILADSGHMTPSLMALKFFSICHLDDLVGQLAADKKCLDYFSKVIVSNFDATRLASLVMMQLSQLKQYRQLQLSWFYIKLLLDVNTIIIKQSSTSWFSSNEISLEKIACVLDFIVRFNFTNQRTELIRKFYSSSMVQGHNSVSNGWLSSFLTSSTPQRDFFTTNLHILTKKFKKYVWLQWVATECDALRLEKVWEDVIAHLSIDEASTLDSAIKKVCPQLNPTLVRSALPIYSWINQIYNIMELDLNHPLCPLIWYNFFLNYFANSLNGVSVGVKLVSQETLARLMSRLDSLYNYHLYKQRNWSSSNAIQQNSLTQLYRAYKLWLQDPSLRDAYVDIGRLKDDYLVLLLKAVMESSNAGACLQYVDLDSIEMQNKNLIQVWVSSTQSTLSDKYPNGDPIIYVDNNDLNESPGDRSLDADDEPADDVVSLIVRSHKALPESKTSKPLDDGHGDFSKLLDDDDYFPEEKKYRTVDELIGIVKDQFGVVFEESTLFSMNISELNRTKTEIIELAIRLYTNKKREYVRVVPCAEGNECVGPARIKIEAEEALMDERKSQCIQDRRRQCQELVGELLLMPKNESVNATMLIEENVRRLINDPLHSKMVIETLLAWLSESENYNQLDGSFYTASHLLKTVLEILSTSDQVDAFNYSLINVCLAHPDNVQTFSPYLSPCSCSTQCFLDLYKTVCLKHITLGPMVTFVLLSKFDIKSWLSKNSNESKGAYNELIVTTCSAFKDIGKEPDKSYELTMDLFRRHLQIELGPQVRNKQEELALVLEQFLKFMDEQALAPNLWLDFLHIIGFNHNSKQENCSKMTIITENVARLAEGQTMFDHQSICATIKTISEHLRRHYESESITLFELYHDYVEQFGVVMLSVTFMWIKSTGDTMLIDDYQLIWKQILKLWTGWVLPVKSCQSRSNYNLMVEFFIISLHYMMHKIPECLQSVLGCILAELCSYVTKLHDDVKIELTILLRCLSNLPWSNMLLTPTEIENLTFLSSHRSHDMSDLVSHIMLQTDVKESLALMRRESLQTSTVVLSVERLAEIIIAQCHKLQGFQLPEDHLGLVSTSNIPRLTSFMLIQSDFLDTRGDELLFKLLKSICIKKVGLKNHVTSKEKLEQRNISDSFERAVIYAQFTSDYLVDLTKKVPTVFQTDNEKPLYKVINRSLVDLEPMLQSDDVSAYQKKILYETLLRCCICDALDVESRLLLARLFADSNSMKNKPNMIGDLLQAAGQFLLDPKILANMTEKLVDLYFSLIGRYEDVFERFHLCAIDVDLYLDACIKEIYPMALMTYYESQLCCPDKFPIDHSKANQDFAPSNSDEPAQEGLPVLAGYMFWLSRLVERFNGLPLEVQSRANKLITILIRLVMRLESSLEQFIIDKNLSVNDKKSSKQLRNNSVVSETSKSSEISQQNPDDQIDASKNITAPSISPNNVNASKTTAKPSISGLLGEHKCLVEFLKQLISFYDSINSSGLWSYLRSSNRSEQSIKISTGSLSIACLLADRTLISLNNHTSSTAQPHLTMLRNELVKLRRNSLVKLEALRKSKGSSNCGHFVDSFIESVQQNSKVQYNELVQLIVTFMQA